MAKRVEEDTMNLLIITQKVDKNDPILGFFHRWIEEFAKNTTSISVLCLFEGEHTLPANVSVINLSKKGKGRIGKMMSFYSYIFYKKKEYDTVFVHMLPALVVLGGFLWRPFGKQILFWYTHKAVDLKLRLATLFAHHIFSASDKSFRLKTKKIHITGHGIDTDFFIPSDKKHIPGKLITTGRISRTKNLHILLEALSMVEGDLWELYIYGVPITKEDNVYQEKLTKKVREYNFLNKIHFMGAVNQTTIRDELQNSELFINISDTGSIDKAVLEALSCGTKVLVSNEAFEDILPSDFLSGKDPKELSQNIKKVLTFDYRGDLRGWVVEEHSLTRLAPKILSFGK